MKHTPRKQATKIPNAYEEFKNMSAEGLLAEYAGMNRTRAVLASVELKLRLEVKP